jgi:hypothetical protein
MEYNTQKYVDPQTDVGEPDGTDDDWDDWGNEEEDERYGCTYP